MATQVVYNPPQPGATGYPQAAPVVFVSLVHKYVGGCGSSIFCIDCHTV